jgi:hypothetical protein
MNKRIYSYAFACGCVTQSRIRASFADDDQWVCAVVDYVFLMMVDRVASRKMVISADNATMT